MLGANIEGAHHSQNQSGGKFLLGRDFGDNHEWTRMDTNVGGEGKNHGFETATRYPRSLAATPRDFSFCLAVPTARLADVTD